MTSRVVRLVAAAVVLQAAAAASVALAFACAALIVLAWLRPRSALCVLAATAPWLDWGWAALPLPPARVLDAAVLSTLIGSWRRRAGGDQDSCGAAHLLMLIVAVSAAARLAVVGAGLPLTETLRDAAQYGRIFLTGAAHPFEIAGHVVSAAAGIALFVATRRTMVDRTDRARLTAALVIGGAIWAIAALEVYGVRSYILDLEHWNYRDALLIADPNAAGSYFVLLLFPAAALAATGPYRGIWSSAVAALLGAIWLTWSSTAILAAAGVLVAVIMSTSRISRRTKVAFALAAVLIVVVQLRMRGSEELARSWMLRRDFVATSVAMIGDEPLFGVGSGRYLELSPQYLSPALGTFYRRENAHNQFLQLAAELGLAGLVAFAVLVWRSLRHQGRDGLPMALGVAAFLLTAFVGHPLLVAPVTVIFWMAIATIGPTGREDARPPAVGRGWLIGAIALLVAFTACFPARVRRERDRTVGTAAGLYAAEHALPLGTYRWSAARVVLFPAREATHVRFTVRRFTLGTPPEPTTVLVGGLQQNHVVTLREGESYCVEGPPRETGLPFYRIDLRIHPVWYNTASVDGRTFGVQLMPAELGHTGSCPK